MISKCLKVFAVSFVVYVLFLFCNPGTVQAADVCGPIVSDTTWSLAGSPYIVTCGIIVQEGVTLTIESGVEVRFDGPYSVMVNGELIARGTADNMITFTSNQGFPEPGYWAHIKFSDSSVDAVYNDDGNYVSGSILENCRVEYAGFSDKGGVWIDRSGPFINHCTISNNSGSVGGIYAYYADNLKITNNTISVNSASYEGGGIYCTWSTVLISGNTIINNSAFQNGGGIYCYGYSKVTISANTISGNSVSRKDGGGIYCNFWGSDANIISNNIINGNSAFNFGGAICIRDFSSSDNSIIINNTLENNTAGTCGGIYVSYGSPVINSNNLLNNGDYEIYNETTNDIDATDNWWGTAVQSKIMAKIYDWYDDPSKGIVDFDFWLATPTKRFPVAVPGGAYSGKIGEVVSFDGSGSYDPDGSIVSWEWDFGDGNMASGESVTCIYNSPNTYTVTLTVTDNDGLSDTDTTTAKIMCTDADNDGYYAQVGCGSLVDCDDDDCSVHPDVIESCDGVDNNCIDGIDEGCGTIIQLNSGWNLIGYNLSFSKPVADALASCDGKYISVWAFIDGAWKVYDPENPGFSDLTTMEPIYGYWINTKEPCTLTY